MAAGLPLHLPDWRDGQAWTYQLVRVGKDAFEGALTYTVSARPNGVWRIEGVSDYPGDRSLHEWLEVGGEPVRPLAAFFERRNASGTYRYRASQGADGSLEMTVETGSGPARQEHHDGGRGPVYIANQLDFLLHGLDLEARGPWPVRLRVESGQVVPGEIKLVGRAEPLATEEGTVPATLVTIRGGANPLIRALAPTLKYWFHPADQTMLLKMSHGETILTLIDVREGVAR